MVANQDEKRQLLGFANFVRNNPKTDRFPCHRFLHMEFYTTDATQAYKRFQHGLGMKLVAKSDQSTGNHTCASYVLQSNEVVLSFTAPYSRKACQLVDSKCPVPHYCAKAAAEFVWKHGLAIHSVGVSVDDAREAYRIATEHGAEGRGPPVVLRDEASGTEQVVAEVKAYGDVVLRFVSGSFQGPYLAGYDTVADSPDLSYGLDRIDHIVGNVPEIFPVVDYLMTALGWHEFAEFTAEDVGTLDSGLNSMVLASNNEFILMPVNEPTFGTKRKSQIQTYLEQNEGSGVQHVALKTSDIFHTLTEMSRRSHCGGFEFVPKPGPEYYAKLPQRIGEDTLTPERFKLCEELGILADRDDQGVLLQIFTKPLGDRPTVFFEIIQRIGCETTVTDAEGHEHVEQAGGCGGFGKGNFSELFKRLEQFETEMGIN